MWKVQLSLILLLGLLVNCGVRERTPQVYDDWGRGSLQGEATRGDEIGIAAQSSGDVVMLAWFGRSPQSTETIQIQTINPNNEIIATLALPLGGESPSDLQLISNDDGATVAWIEQVGSWRVLRIVGLGWNGIVDEDEVVISAENSDIRWYSLQPARIGGHYLFWLDDSDILHGEWLHEGVQDRIFDQSNAQSADFVEANDGTLHIAWQTLDQTLTYTQLPLDRLRPRSASILTTVGSDFTLLLDETYVYVSWIESASSEIFYTTFEIPDIVPPTLPSDAAPILIPWTYPPTRTTAQSTAFPYTHLSSLATEPFNIATTDTHLRSLRGQRDEAALATTLLFRTQSRQQTQPAVIYFDEGEVQGYQALSWTQNRSDGVEISADSDNNLYLGWIDTQRGNRSVYLITTQPTLQDATSDLTWTDYRVIIMEGIGRILRAFQLVFLVLPWLLTPVFYFFFVVAILSGNMMQPRARTAFLVGILVYEGVKFWFGLRGDAGLMYFIPNSEFINREQYQQLVYLVPLLILFISLLCVWLVYLRRVREVVHSTWFILLIGLDYVLSLGFYALAYFA